VADLGRDLSPAEILAAVPQREPFRFIDEILAVDEERISACYRFRADADFYRGHFPGNPVTPGVLLVEAMAQAGVVAHGIYLSARAAGEHSVPRMVAVFTDATVEFVNLVRPGERVLIEGRKIFFRRRKLRSAVEMRREDGEVVCHGTISGVGLPG
jgi:3-hydroxyacyl-[acyl-carrier-protein] dehydratase